MMHCGGIRFSRTLIGKKFLVAVIGFIGAVYHNVITGFPVWYVSMVCVVALAVVGSVFVA